MRGGCGTPQAWFSPVQPARGQTETPGTQEAAAHGGEIGPGCWPLAPQLRCWELGASSGGLAEPGGASQGGGPSWLGRRRLPVKLQALKP